MGTGGEDRHFFPLTSLQIGDLQSYLSHLTIFLANKSKKFFILVDNRPWLRDHDKRPALLWHLMVTKSRLSPFANTRARRDKKDVKRSFSLSNSFRSSSINRNKSRRWLFLIYAAIGQKKTLLPVKKLKDTLLLNKELHHTLYGFIVFEVGWADVRGINYINELQTDTSMALEAKSMKRWEFDSVEHASSCISSWYIGNCDECYLLQEYLDSVSGTGDLFYDAQEGPSTSNATPGNFCSSDEFHAEGVLYTDSCPAKMVDIVGSSFTTPPAFGPNKRRKIMKSSFGSDSDEASEEAYSEVVSSPTLSVSSSFSMESEDASLVPEVTTYKDVLILFRFDDHDLPFRLKEIIISDLRLLRLLEYGLPSWVIFLQSYPVFCKIYRPWMCPLARALYVMISVITVLIGFYDLYKNVPVLKATASHLFGPLIDWIETWEMISRIRYLGTMLFLQNFEKAVKWFLMITRATKSLFSILTKPIADPIMEVMEFIFPFWNLFIETVESISSVIGIVLTSACGVTLDVLEILVWPVWFIFSMLWSIAAYVICPVLWLFWEIVIAPARLVLAIASFLGMLFINVYYLLWEIWLSISSMLQLASASESTVAVYEVSVWRSLWNDLFSKVFRALRSILYGLIAALAACNRHRLSIYNHICEFLLRLSDATQNYRSSHHGDHKKIERTQSPVEESGSCTTKHNFLTEEKLRRRCLTEEIKSEM